MRFHFHCCCRQTSNLSNFDSFPFATAAATAATTAIKTESINLELIAFDKPLQCRNVSRPNRVSFNCGAFVGGASEKPFQYSNYQVPSLSVHCNASQLEEFLKRGRIIKAHDRK